MFEAHHPSIGTRKDDHVRLATEQAARRGQRNDFDDLAFLHHALNAVDLATVDMTTDFFGVACVAPLYINAMTGGSERTAEINAQLARVAARTGVPIASGSMSAVLKDPSVADSYRVLREENPEGVVLANIGAGTDPDRAIEAVDLVSANALQIHVNSIQEVVMPEGDRTFAHWPAHIRRIVDASPVPVIVKEVGFGISRETIDRLADLGVQYIDLSGRGGTNFARIENQRRPDQDFDVFDAWGQSTACALIDALGPQRIPRQTLFASGGVRHALDVAKALALGASAVGVAGGFLGVLQRDGEDALVAEIQLWTQQLTSILAVLGARTPSALCMSTDILVTGSAREFAAARGRDIVSLAHRSSQPHADLENDRI